MSSARVLLLLAACVLCVSSARSQYMQPVWQTIDFGQYLGLTNIHIIDLDGDDQNEIVAGAGGFPNPFFVVLSHRGSEFEVGWVGGHYADFVITQIAVAPSATGAMIFVGLHHGIVDVYDGSTMARVDSFDSGVVGLSNMLASDVDDDGTIELLIGTDHLFRIYDAETFNLEWESSAYDARRFAVGNTDDDDQSEIVFSTGVVLDGLSHDEQWQYAGGFGDRVDLGDIDQDGNVEILASIGARLLAFDPQLKTPLWEFMSSDYITDFRVADLDGDGKVEALLGDDNGRLRGYALPTLELVWSFDDEQYGLTRIVVGNTDNDETAEVVMAAGYNGNSGGRFVVVDALTRHVDWQSTLLSGPFFVRLGHLDEDVKRDILAASASSLMHYDRGKLFMLEAGGSMTEWIPGPGPLSGEIHALAVRDLNADRIDDIIVGSYGWLTVYDGSTHQSTRQTEFSVAISALDVADIDGDGFNEIAVGDALGYITLLSGSTQTQIWKSIQTGERIGGIVLADCDDDDALEIVFYNLEGHIHVYDGITLLLEWQSVGTSGVTALEVADVDGDAENEIVAGRTDGTIAVFDGNGFSETTEVSVAEQMVTGLAVANLDASPESELIVGAQTLRILRTSDFEMLWESERLESNRQWVQPGLGSGRNIAVVDRDRDGLMDVIAGGSWGLFQFEATEPYPDTTPPELIQFSPPDGLVSAGVDVAISAHFSEPLDESLIQNNVELTGGGAGSLSAVIAWQPADSSVRITPDLMLPPQTVVQVRFSGALADQIGNSLDGNRNGLAEGSPEDDVTWSFTTGTGIDSIGPVVHVLPHEDTLWVGAPLTVRMVATDTSSVATGTLSAVEAYVDEPDNMVTILPDDGSFDDSVDSGRASVSTVDLPEGPHLLYVRAVDERGNWGMTVEIPFVVRTAGLYSWAMYGFDAQHTGANVADTLTAPLIESWTTGESIAIRAAITVGDRVVVTGHRHSDGQAYVSVHEIGTGVLQWQQVLGQVSIGVPAYGYGRVFVQTNSHTPGSFVSALDLGSGEIQWETPYSAQWSMGVGPTVHGGRVFTNGGYYGGMYGYDAFTGDELWFTELAQYDSWAPAAIGDTVYAFVGGKLSAVHVESGATVWTMDVPVDESGWNLATSPVIDREGGRIFLTWSSALYAVDLNTREILWAKSGTFQNNPAYHEGLLYVVNENRLLVYDAATGEQEWLFVGDRNLRSGPVIAGESIFVGSEANMYAVNRISRQEEWRVGLGSTWETTMAAGSGHFLMVTNGALHVFKPNPTRVSTEDPGVPLKFALLPNYPNPFNPSTTITYRLAAPSDVLVEVFNVVGQHVTTLVDARQAGGEYRLTWDASGVSSGVYLLRLRTHDQVETRQMVLLR